MSAAYVPQLTLATGETITLTADEVGHVVTGLYARRMRKAKTRNVVSEVVAFLDLKPGSSTIEIARAIGARDSHVRRVLQTDPQFQNVPAGRGLSARLRAWIVAPNDSQPGPRAGTTAPASRHGQP